MVTVMKNTQKATSSLGMALERARDASLARSHEEKSKAARLAIQHRDRKELERTLKKARRVSLARTHEEKSKAARLAIQHRDRKELEQTLKKARAASLARSHEEKAEASHRAALKRTKKTRSKAMKTVLNLLVLLFSLGAIAPSQTYAVHRQEVVSTEAGSIDFSFAGQIKHPRVYHKIHHIHLNDKMVELSDGSRWSIPKIDSIKGWDQGARLVLTQNHLIFSTSRYALMNLNLKLAVPVALLREPTPGQEAYFIKAIDMDHDKVILNDNKSFIVHHSDRGELTKMHENNRIVMGANTAEDEHNNPYLLINTTKNIAVRAQIIE